MFTEAVEMHRAAQRATSVVLTPRLRLTPIGPADIDDLIVLHRDPLVAFWTGPWNPATVRTWATDMATRWNTEGVGKWLARSRSDASLVGRGGFTRFDLDGESVLELGWVVRDALTDRGYATEIGRAALDWAAIHESRTPIVAFTEVHNQPSQAVMRRLGMRAAGMIRRPGLVQGRPGLHPAAPFALYRLEHDDRVV
ncbi:MAG: GNAT family N-acetyltransferase [Actinomycetota bacterium]|nr:GNAT family N-acetyltransferase [Actinomycetota bacterium]